MRSFWLHLKLRTAIFIFLILAFIICFFTITFSRVNKGGGQKTRVSERQRLTVQYGINCTAIYEMEPVEVGKTLAIRKQKTYVSATDQTIADATTGCDQFASQGYDAIQGTEFEREFPLAYSLVVHHDAALVERMLRAIYMPHNIYCIHYDLKSSADFISAMKGLARCIPNVFIASKLERVQYAGISRLKADLNCLSNLLDSVVKWKYVINLCGQDFPLRTNAELVSDLKALKGRNMVESKRPEGKKWRWSVHHILKNNKSEYYETPVTTSEEKSPPPYNIEMFVGSAYFTLSREFVFFVQWSFLASDFLAWSEDTYSPDEHFWATLVRVPGVPGEVPRSEPEISELISKTRLVKWSYLEENLYPPCTGDHVRGVCIYGAAELRWLLNYGHWFANKVDPKVDPVLMECLEEILLEKRPKLQ
ncbi:beta-1,3-galactosyl-O-glycosyl-glycoprotein beta-1,6-N-acetylglucosaminyltransferase 4-like [Rhinichthys klamathensis goyatoka]|uniref:beta-1,3-galactosyl-O-glycosyl-glycoprotein beta-1,6-N-acetylglucosaminyltransferase 4-like n=1 Tax=Rhinichthys klamathensis goyatoka TaxID=3034132 RepID=UPI0024B62E26|nr:beta-1,3-galactosyl-O-glycosyl-glycoprotein beta-1,6-N-acetylglucosaminyltransferase 4-like [Rhinichthys klamathensis goyatoka]